MKRIQSGTVLATDSNAASSAAPAQEKGKGEGKGKGKGNNTSKEKGGGQDRSASTGRIPASSGVCFRFARSGKYEKDNCTFQHVSAGQLRKALGDDTSSGASAPKASGRGNQAQAIFEDFA